MGITSKYQNKVRVSLYKLKFLKDEWPLMQIMTEVVEDLDSSYLEEEQNGYSNESEGELNEGSEVTENNSPEKAQTPKSKKKTKRVTKRKKAEATTDDENEGENGEEAGSSAKKKKKKKPAKAFFER